MQKMQMLTLLLGCMLAQAVHVAETTLLQDAWARGQQVAIHGVIYGLNDGLIHDLGVSLKA